MLGCKKIATMYMHHYLSVLAQGIAQEPRVAQQRAERQRQVIMDNGIGMHGKHHLPPAVAFPQCHNTVKALTLVVTPSQKEKTVVCLPVVVDDEPRNAGYAADVVLRVERW